MTNCSVSKILSFVAMVVFLSGTVPMDGAASEKVTLADFAWLVGHWQGELDKGRLAENFWAEAEAGVMMGMFRLVEGDKTLILEFFSLRETEQGIELRVRHFDTALNPWEEGDPIVLNLRRHDGSRFVFENLIHTSPKWSFLTRTEEDSYVGRSEIIRADGTEAVIEVVYHRVKPEVGELRNPSNGTALDKGNPLSALAWLVGGKWVAEAEGPDGKPMIRESFFEWAANRRALRFWSIIKLHDGKAVPYVEGAYFWHPGKKSLWFWYVDPGSYYEGEVLWDGKRLDHIYEGVNAKGEREKWRYWFERESEDRMPIKIFSHKDGVWSEIVSLTYERQN